MPINHRRRIFRPSGSRFPWLLVGSRLDLAAENGRSTPRAARCSRDSNGAGSVADSLLGGVSWTAVPSEEFAPRGAPAMPWPLIQGPGD
jgi:hypothetical protein